MKTKFFGAATVVFLAFVVAGVYADTVIAAPPQDLDMMIRNARTSADHEALAARYNADAQAAQAEAEKHEQMAKNFRLLELGSWKGPKMARHCERLAASYRAVAEQDKELATLHRDLAAQLGQQPGH